MRDFLTLDDLDFKDKIVLLRVDINVPVDKDTKKISESKRITESITTIKELTDKKSDGRSPSTSREGGRL